MLQWIFCRVSGEEAKKVFDDAQKMLVSIVNNKLLKLVGQIAFFRANSVQDDIHVFDNDQCKVGTPKAIFHGLRQQVITIWV